ncbi:hypothetical protein IAI09_24345 (plasmid) [Lysinibacillus fusiformis]|nr:hypothetical protein [Lysinibacillus fusiformis]
MVTTLTSYMDRNILNYEYGARVTWADYPYGASHYTTFTAEGDIKGSYKPSNLDPTSGDSWWTPNNHWHVQGSVENDDDKDVAHTHTGTIKAGSSSTTISTYYTVNGFARFIINPRAYQKEAIIFLVNELYIASASSDGDVGDYEIYATESTDMSVQYKPNDPSWKLVAVGRVTADKVLQQTVLERSFKFTFIKVHAKVRSKGYMEMAAIKAYGEIDDDKVFFLNKDTYKTYLDSKWIDIGNDLTKEKIETYGKSILVELKRRPVVIALKMENKKTDEQGKVFFRSINLIKYQQVQGIIFKSST